MNTRIQFRDEATKAAMKIPELRVALEDWHSQETNDGVTEVTFGPWLWSLIDSLSAHISKSPEKLPIEWMVNALKVQVGLIPTVKKEMEGAKEHFGLEDVDMNTCVSEGMVYISIWLKGKKSQAAAESIEKFLTSSGYSTDVWDDSEREDEFTVNATREFDGKEVR